MNSKLHFNPTTRTNFGASNRGSAPQRSGWIYRRVFLFETTQEHAPARFLSDPARDDGTVRWISRDSAGHADRLTTLAELLAKRLARSEITWTDAVQTFRGAPLRRDPEIEIAELLASRASAA